MPSNSLISLDRGPSPLALSRRSSLLDNARKGIPVAFAVLGYKGRNFRVKYRGDEAILKDERGPVSFVDTVIIGVSSAISRQYFARSYTEGDDQGPDCYSTDGEKPDDAAPKKQNPVCATCRHAMWGSRMTDGGKKAKECQDTRRVAVVPLDDIENKTFGGAMLLRLPPMSIANLSKYAEFLAHKGASFETVATRIAFDSDVAYPRLTFEALGFLDETQQRLVIGDDGNGGVCASTQINRVLYASDQPTTPEPYGPQQPTPAETPTEQEEEPDEEEGEPEPEKAAANPFRAAAPAAAPRRTRRTKPKEEPQMEAAPAGMERALDSLFGSKKTH
jgi:hypothetical protein